VSRTLRFVRRQQEAADTASFYFEPDSPLPFVAGQYLRYTVRHTGMDDRGPMRSFTIASAPSEPLLRLTTRLSRRPSSFKHALAELAPGAVLEFDGPHGNFVYHPTERPSVFIAGGIGITPFRAMLGDLAANRPANLTLLYSNATPDIPFRTYFESLAADWPALQVVYTVTQPSDAWHGPTGRIDAPFIERYVPHVDEADYYVCGPSALVEALRAVLVERGVDESRIQTEGFPGYEAAGSAPPPRPAITQRRALPAR
jgi:ferredoxin-NADP reductase